MLPRPAVVLAVVLALPLVACQQGAHPPASPRRAQAEVRERWRWEAPPPAYVGMPASDEGGVAFTSAQSRLVLLDAGGRVQWVTEHGQLRDVAPRLAPARVVAATEHGLAAFDRATGSVIWSAALGERANTPARAGSTLVASTWDASLSGVDEATGAIRWRASLPGPALGPAATDGSVAVATWAADDGTAAGALAVDATTGERRWEVQLPPGGVSAPAVSGAEPGARSGASVSAGASTGASARSGASASAAVSGAEPGARSGAGAGASAGAPGQAAPRPATAESRRVVVVVAGDVAAHGLDVETGVELWRTEVEGAGAPEVPPLALPGGRVLVGHRLGGMVLLDAGGGAQWRVASDGAAVRGGPAGPGDGGRFALPLDDGRVLVAGPDAPTSVLDPPGRVSGVATGPGGLLLVATREAPANGVTAWSGW